MKDPELKDLLPAQRIYIILGALFIASLSHYEDTFSVLFLLCTFIKIDWALFGPLLLSGFLLKVLVVACDTPFPYVGVFGFGKRFDLQPAGDSGF